MIEVKLAKNSSGLQIFVNGVPNLKNIPSELSDLAITTLELQASEYCKNKRKHLIRDKPKTQN